MAHFMNIYIYIYIYIYIEYLSLYGSFNSFVRGCAGLPFGGIHFQNLYFYKMSNYVNISNSKPTFQKSRETDETTMLVSIVPKFCARRWSQIQKLSYQNQKTSQKLGIMCALLRIHMSGSGFLD